MMLNKLIYVALIFLIFAHKIIGNKDGILIYIKFYIYFLFIFN